jgi:hypothetical protein
MDIVPLLGLLHPFINVKWLFLSNMPRNRKIAMGMFPNAKVTEGMVTRVSAKARSLGCTPNPSPSHAPISPYLSPSHPLVYTLWPVLQLHALPSITPFPLAHSVCLHPDLPRQVSTTTCVTITPSPSSSSCHQPFLSNSPRTRHCLPDALRQLSSLGGRCSARLGTHP